MCVDICIYVCMYACISIYNLTSMELLSKRLSSARQMSLSLTDRVGFMLLCCLSFARATTAKGPTPYLAVFVLDTCLRELLQQRLVLILLMMPARGCVVGMCLCFARLAPQVANRH